MDWYWDLLRKRSQMQQEGSMLAKSMFEDKSRERMGNALLDVQQEAPIPQGGISPEEYIGNDNRYSPNFLAREQPAQAYGGLINAGYSKPQADTLMGLLGTQMPEKPTTFARDFAAYQQADQPTRDLMSEFKQAGAMNINMGSGAGTIWGPEKVAQAGLPTGSVVTQDRYGKPQILNKEKYTQPQILSGTYAARMDDATRSIDEIMASGNFDPAGVKQNIDLFGAPEMLANYMRSPEGQIYRQAQENWISANLRKESGAAIPEEELEREIKKWFPQPGDDPKTIAKKNAARKTAARGMQKAAGGSYQELIDQGDKDRLNELRQKYAP